MAWSEKTILFDLDGTLVDSAPDLHASLVYALTSAGLPAVDLSAVRRVVGHGARYMIERASDELNLGLDTDTVTSLHKKFLEYYVENISDHTRPFDGIIETLDICRANNAKIAVCTNKPQSLSEQLLKDLKLTGYFTAILGADRASEKKPSPIHIEETVSLAGGDIRNAVMIGDSSADGLAAQAAEVPFIFMTYGYSDPKVESLQPFRKLDSAGDLPAAIHAVFT